jgi:hypothetical protein
VTATAFNTKTSMGRLTLNVLLSFAQFEREVTSERIRDKIGASERRGLWVGGNTEVCVVKDDIGVFSASQGTRVPIPGWFGVLRMRDIQIDPTHIAIMLRIDYDLMRHLDKTHRLHGGQQKGRNTCWPASRRARPHRLAGKYIFIGFLQFILRKLREVRIVDVSHPKCRLPTDIIGDGSIQEADR